MGSPKLGRREFIRRTAAIGVASATVARHGGAKESAMPQTPTVDPAEVGVDAELIARATTFVASEIESGSVPGAALVATRGGRCFLRGCWGSYCDGLRRDAPYGLGVVNLLYSFSKVISATVVIMVWQDGLVGLDVPVVTYIPEMAGGGREAITLRHLLTHSAGIPSVQLGPAGTEEQWRQCVRTVCSSELEWEPGSRTAYHGFSGLFVAAEVVRRVSGMSSWQDICSRRLFEPLGTEHLSFELPPEGTPVSVTPQPADLPSPPDAAHLPFLGHPAGGAFGSADDMLKLLNLHLNEGIWEGNRLLQEEAFREMHRLQYADEIAAAADASQPPRHEFWELGWLRRGTTREHWFGFGDRTSVRTFGHAGISTVMGLADPETSLALAFLTTDSPASDAETVRLRNTVTNLVADSLGVPG
jgi:CubicO group peptidase (beta-lactamase class C family)